MVEIKLSKTALQEIRSHYEALKKKLAELRKTKKKIFSEEEETLQMLRGIWLFTEGKVEETAKQEAEPKAEPLSLIPVDSERKSLWRAAVDVLKAAGRPMTANQILDSLKKQGRKMESPNSRDMITLALKKVTKFVEIHKNGKANVYKYREGE